MEVSAKISDNIEESIKKELNKIRAILDFLKQIKQFDDYLHEEKWKKILEEKYLQNIEKELNKKKDEFEAIKSEYFKDFKSFNYSKDLEKNLCSYSHNSNSNDAFFQNFLPDIKSQFKHFEQLFSICYADYGDNCGGQISNSFYRKLRDLAKSIKILSKEIKFDENSSSFSDIECFLNTSNTSCSTLDSEYRQIYIISTKEFEKEIINNNNSYNVKTICINKEYFSDLSKFKNIELINLVKLNLNSNHIKDLSPLKSCNFFYLENLKFENNELNNECIEVLKQIKLPNLLKLNLFDNKITTIKIFEILDNFKKIKLFYIGKNKFDEKELYNNKDNYISLPDSLEILGLSQNFDKKTNYFIKNIKMNDLKILYLSNNELNSLEVLGNIDFKRLHLFWAPYNRIRDAKELLNLNNKEEIAHINLTGNEITTIDENIFRLFKNLKTLNLRNNKLNDKHKDLITKYEEIILV